MKINKDEFLRLTGLVFDELTLKGLTRDCRLFGLFENANEEQATAIRIEKENDRFTLKLKTEDGYIIKGQNIALKSVAARICDLAFFSKNEEFLRLADFGGTNKTMFDHMLDRDIIIIEEINSYNELIKSDEIDDFKDKIMEWSKYKDVKNAYLNINTRIKTIILKYAVERYGYDVDEETYKMIFKKYPLNFQIFVDMINKWMSAFIIVDEIEIPAVKKAISLSGDLFSLSFGEIDEVVKEARVMIPAFQRDYVWDVKKVIPFLNSLVNNYPIGSILISDSDYDLKGKNEVFDNIKYPITKSGRKCLVLDGQQRITTMLMILNIRNLIDLKTNFSKAFKTKINDLSKIYYFDKTFYSTKELVAKGISKSELYKYAIVQEDVFKSFYNKIANYSVPFIKTIDWDKNNLDQIIKIFECINVGGTNLSNVDLIHTALFDKDNKFELLDYLQAILDNDKCKFFGLDKKILVQVAKIVYDMELSGGADVNINESTILELSLGENAKKLIKAMKKVNDIIQRVVYFWNTEYGITNRKELKNIALILNVAAMIIKDKKYLEDFNSITFGSEYKILVRDCMFKTTLGKYSAGTAGKINDDIKNMMKTNTIDIDYEENKQSIKEGIQNNIDKAAHNKQNIMYSLIIGMLSLKNPVSLINGKDRVIANTISKWETQDKDQHHFVPKKNKKFKELFEEINGFENICIISSEENRKEIRTRSPFDYLLNKSNNDDANINEVAKTHLFNKEDVIKIINNESKDVNECFEILNTALINRKTNILNELKNKLSLEGYMD